MAEPSIPVSAIRSALAEELSSTRRAAQALRRSDAAGYQYLLAKLRAQYGLIRALEERTGTAIRRRPR